MNLTVTTVTEIIYKTTVTIAVQNGPTPNIRDYVALYLPGAPTYLDWFYVASGTKIRAAQGKPTGTVKFTVMKLGKYEAKLISLTDAGVATLLTPVPVLFEIVAPGVVIPPPPPPPPPPPTTLALLDANLLTLLDEAALTIMEN